MPHLCHQQALTHPTLQMKNLIMEIHLVICLSMLQKEELDLQQRLQYMEEYHARPTVAQPASMKNSLMDQYNTVYCFQQKRTLLLVLPLHLLILHHLVVVHLPRFHLRLHLYL